MGARSDNADPWREPATDFATSAGVSRAIALAVQAERRALTTAAAWRSLGPLAGAIVGSVTWFLSLRIAYALDHGERFVKPDLWCDLALHALPIAGALAWLDWRVGVVAGVVLFGLYVWTYPDATP